jgi:hypothetical protein
MLMRSFLFNQKSTEGAERISTISGFEIREESDSCYETIRYYLNILYSSLEEGFGSNVGPNEKSGAEKKHNKKTKSKTKKKVLENKSDLANGSLKSLSKELSVNTPERFTVVENQESKCNPSLHWKKPEEIQDEGSTEDSEAKIRSRTNSNGYLENKNGYSKPSSTQNSDKQLSNPHKNLTTPKSSGFNSIKKILGHRPTMVPFTSESEGVY